MALNRKTETHYERLLAEERLILDATEAVVALLDEQGISRRDLARRLGKSKGFVSQLLSGERNMTLRTLADLGHALGRSFSVIPSADPRAVFAIASPRTLLGSFEIEYQRTAGEASHSIPPEAVEASLHVVAADAHEYALAV